MKERPIPLKAWEVQAILAGRKSQLRRMVKPQPPEGWTPEWYGMLQPCVHGEPIEPSHRDRWGVSGQEGEWGAFCPFGQPGDREWRRGKMPGTGWYYVRGLLGQSLGGDDRAVWVDPASFTWGFTPKDDPEAIQLDTTITPENIEWKRTGDRLYVKETHAVCCLCTDCTDEKYSAAVNYRATDEMMRWEGVKSGKYHVAYAADGGEPIVGRWRPSIHMPRWASRIILEVVSVRVERVQDISDTDLCAEGYEGKRVKCCPDGQVCPHEGMTDRELIECGVGDADNAVEWYADLWDSINGDGSWESNPWTWAVTFKRIEANP